MPDHGNSQVAIQSPRPIPASEIDRMQRVNAHFNRMWGEIAEMAGVSIAPRYNGPDTYGATTQEGAREAHKHASKPGKAGPEPEFAGDPVVFAPDVPQGATDEYTKLAASLGVPLTNDLRSKLFEDALRRNEVVVYSLADVEAYLWRRCKWLNDKAGYDASTSTSGERITWCWQPLAKYAVKDTVPVEALRAAEQVKNLVPTEQQNALEFQVSKIYKDPDPFLSVSYCGRRYVLFHWDEPGFSVAK